VKIPNPTNQIFFWLTTAVDEASRAARIVGIDYADALTGFEFRGRHGTAVLKGVVVAVEYREAIEAVIEGFRDEQAQAEEEIRTLAALRMWKRFLLGLRIKERVDAYEVEGEETELVQGDYDDGMQGEEYIDAGAGGFFPE
jgi:xeroderma pigmentosum group C-complementing protein